MHGIIQENCTTINPSNASECVSGHLKYKKILGGACPQTPLICRALWPATFMAEQESI